MIKKNKKIFFVRSEPGLGGQIFIFCIIRDETIEQYQYFHMNKRNSKKYFFPGAFQVGGATLFIFFIIRDRNFNIFINICMIIKEIQTNIYMWTFNFSSNLYFCGFFSQYVAAAIFSMLFIHKHIIGAYFI